MERNSKFNELVKQQLSQTIFSEKEKRIIEEFIKSYQRVVQSKENPPDIIPILQNFLEKVSEVKKHPFAFAPYHHHITKPFDYYQFGLDFIRPLVDLPHSTVEGEEHLDELERSLARGENGVLLANHQIEADPQAISILLEKSHPKLAEEMIFVAGERVITDPFAIPFSMGRNLLCIYSKKYIDTPPHLKADKQHHNKKTMELMSSLLREGGKCIYVAPSGGRDRPNKEDVVEVAPFDPQSVEMFYLMAKKAQKNTKFYPLALKTYALLPPPETTQIELGEARHTHGGSIHLDLGPPIDMENFPGSLQEDKQLRRKARADYIWGLVKSAYEQFP